MRRILNKYTLFVTALTYLISFSSLTIISIKSSLCDVASSDGDSLLIITGLSDKVRLLRSGSLSCCPLPAVSIGDSVCKAVTSLMYEIVGNIVFLD